MTSTYRIKRGETLTIPLEAVDADDADLAIVASVDAGLKRAVGGLGVPASRVDRVATFASSVRAKSDDVGPGWNLVLSAPQTLALAPATYVMDAVLHLAAGGAVEISEPLLIRIDQAVSI